MWPESFIFGGSMNLTSIYYTAIAVIIIGFLIYYQSHKNKHKEESGKATNGQDDKPVKIYKPVNAEIIDNDERLLYEKVLGSDIITKIIEKHETLGRQWNHDGKKVYKMIKETIEGVVDYKPLYVSATSARSPELLHEDMQQPEIPILMAGLKDEGNFIEKYGWILLLIGAIGFCIVLIILNKGAH